MGTADELAEQVVIQLGVLRVLHLNVARQLFTAETTWKRHSLYTSSHEILTFLFLANSCERTDFMTCSPEHNMWNGESF